MRKIICGAAGLITLAWLALRQKEPATDTPMPRTSPESVSEKNTTQASSALVPDIQTQVEGILAETDDLVRLDLAMKMAARATAADVEVMIDLVVHSDNEELVQGAQTATADHISNAQLTQLITLYESAASEAAAARIAGIVSEVHKAEALPVLGEILFSPTIPIDDALSAGALTAITRLGTPQSVNIIAKRLDQAKTDEHARLATALKRIRKPGAERELNNIVLGRRDWNQPHTRLAALHALANFPQSLSQEALQQLIKADDTPAVLKKAASDLLSRGDIPPPAGPPDDPRAE